MNSEQGIGQHFGKGLQSTTGQLLAVLAANEAIRIDQEHVLLGSHSNHSQQQAYAGCLSIKGQEPTRMLCRNTLFKATKYIKKKIGC